VNIVCLCLIAQWLLLYKRHPSTDDSKEATSNGLDTDIDRDTAKRVIKAMRKWKGGDPTDFKYYSTYGARAIGGNHKSAGMKAAFALMPKEKRLARQEVKVFWGLTLGQQRKVCQVTLIAESCASG